MPDIQKGDTFVDGQVVTGARLNNLIDLAQILAAFISAKPTETAPTADDYVVIFEATSSLLKKARVDAIPGVASVNLTSALAGTTIVNTTPTGPAVNIAINQVAQLKNRVLAAPDNATGNPTFREITARDVAVPVHVIPATLIDWSLGTTHYKQISSTPTTFTFTGGVDGQSVIVELYITAAGFNVFWPGTVWWEGGTAPQISQTIGGTDIFQFWYGQGGTVGKRIVTNAKP